MPNSRKSLDKVAQYGYTNKVNMQNAVKKRSIPFFVRTERGRFGASPRAEREKVALEQMG